MGKKTLGITLITCRRLLPRLPRLLLGAAQVERPGDCRRKGQSYVETRVKGCFLPRYNNI